MADMTNEGQDGVGVSSSTLSTLGRRLGIGGAATIMIGGAVFYVFGADRLVAVISGLGGLVAAIGFGLAFAFSEPLTKETSDQTRAAQDVGNVELASLARELRRPWFSSLAILLALCLTAPAVLAAAFGRPWSLIALAFPTALVITIAFAALARKYDATKRVLISRLSEAEKQKFLCSLEAKRSLRERRKK